MYLCYVDESGDKGYERSLTSAYALGVLLVPDRTWLRTLDAILGWRRALKREFGIPIRAELKAGHFIHNTGPFERLNVSDEARMKIYRRSLRLISKVHNPNGVAVFAVVVDKEWMKRCHLTYRDPECEAWELAIERLETFTRKNKETCMILPDEGEYHTGLLPEN